MTGVIIVWTDTDECRAQHQGAYVGGILGGSFVTFVCDQPRGHAPHTDHVDSTHGFVWPARELVAT